MKDLRGYCKKALTMGFDGAKIIKPRSIITADWVRMKCQFGCSGFGQGHCCPPYSPTPDVTRRVIDSYHKAILLHRRLRKGERSRNLTQKVVRLEREIFLDGYYKAWGMGAGPCRLCHTCDTTAPCQHGEEARPSMEACGIDVFKTARDNGFRINVVRSYDDERNSFGVILVE